MRLQQPFQRQGRRQLARVPHLQPVGKQHHLHAGTTGVVAVRHRVDDGFGHRLARQLVVHRHLRAFGARAHAPRHLGQHKVQRRVHQLEHRALEHLVRRNRLAHLQAVEVHALQLRRRQKALRPGPEQQHRRMAGGALVQQVQVGQRRRDGRAGAVHVAALRLRPGQEQLQLVGGQVVQPGLGAGRRVERLGAQPAGALQPVNQAGVHGGLQRRLAVELAAHHLAFGPAHQRRHLGVPVGHAL